VVASAAAGRRFTVPSQVNSTQYLADVKKFVLNEVVPQLGLKSVWNSSLDL